MRESTVSGGRARAGAPGRVPVPALARQLPATAVPAPIRPMLPTAACALPSDDDAYGSEVKWDGVRAVVYLAAGRVRVLSRSDRDVTAVYPELADLAQLVTPDGHVEAVLDGELVSFDSEGRPDFAALQLRMQLTRAADVARVALEVPVCYLVFDVLRLAARSTLDLRYDQRRELLDGLRLAGPNWQTPPAFAGGGADVLASTTARGLEGVVAKRLDSRYTPGRRSTSWLKVKTLRTQEVVVLGWKPGAGRRTGGIGSLLLAVGDAEGRLRYVGHVGTGFTDRMLDELAAQLQPLESLRAAAPDVPPEHARAARWVEPRIVGEVVFGEWTRDGRLRHPSWRGLRPDKTAAEVVREP
ncbi:MAG TPA: non-homologous end-joining DNA ligase [Mycobacteriales bacterium]|nr:non-homologous end-joining DNA ligase [Mycobacteriales bacterium]